ncbi:hypothetical protein [Mycolicibacterium komossense]|uniref:hypothetical protein n=1 Tax=Mycolicibacterium komossense TaxID=1779 RepID=UPI0021F2C730|nr:hypothetical protein [Mycolicibacterium komossense]
MRIDARPDYERVHCTAERTDGGVLLSGDGDAALFVLEVFGSENTAADTPSRGASDNTDALLDATTAFWRRWFGRTDHQPARIYWREP